MTVSPTRNLRKAAWWAAGVAVLAAVIFGVPALQPSRDDGAPTSDSASFLADRALQALESGDTTAALGFAERALAQDPGNEAAKTVAERVERERAAAPGSAAGEGAGTTPPPDPADSDAAFQGPLADPSALLPREFAGFSLGLPVSMDGEFTRSGTADAQDATARSVIWTVRDTGSADAASLFITRTSKVLYPEGGSTVTIDGASAYSGTDGTRYASIVYARGRYVFEVLVSGTDGALAGYRRTAIDASRAFGDAPAK